MCTDTSMHMSVHISMLYTHVYVFFFAHLAGQDADRRTVRLAQVPMLWLPVYIGIADGMSCSLVSICRYSFFSCRGGFRREPDDQTADAYTHLSCLYTCLCTDLHTCPHTYRVTCACTCLYTQAHKTTIGALRVVPGADAVLSGGCADSREPRPDAAQRRARTASPPGGRGR